jgi:MFS family permease
VGQLIAGRAINGLCIGVTTSQVPVYLAEIAKAERRGTVVIIQQLACEFGILIMYFLSYGCSVSINQVVCENDEADTCVLQFISGPASFRVAWAMQWIPSVLLFFLLPFLPESPRWFAKVGRKKEAIEVLARIQANGDVNDPLVIAEWEEISITNQAENEAGNIIQKLFFRGMWKRTLAGFTVQMWQQLSGANVMVYYLTYIAEIAGLTGNIAMITSGIQVRNLLIYMKSVPDNSSTLYSLSSLALPFCSLTKSDAAGLLIWGALSMGLCHFIVGAIMATNKVNVRYMPFWAETIC